VAHCIKQLIYSIIQPKKNWKTHLLYQWNDIIGSLHNKVRIEKIYEDTIVLGVFHSCWMQELYLLSPLLIKTINEKLDQPYIKQIRFKHISAKKNIDKKTVTRNVTNQIIQLSHQDERALTKVTDPRLREVLKLFRVRCYREL
jgi:hypothetical protein